MFDIDTYNRELIRAPDKIKNIKCEWIDIYDEMRVHTRGESPGKLLTDRRPNEDQDILEYRLSIYQPITKGPINRSINKLFRIFLNANFSYTVSESLQDYLEEKRFMKRNFFEFFHGAVTKRMIEDPNGYLLWLPAGMGLESQTEKVDVVPELLDCNRIWYVDDEVLTWCEGKIKENELPEILYSLTKDAYWVHIRRNDVYYPDLLYKHDLGMIPAVLLGGILKEDGIHESYFNSFLPFGNEAIRRFSDDQAVGVRNAFPFRTEKYTECDYPKCGGRGWYEEDCGDDCIPKILKCPVCHGTGYKSHTSPYGTFIRKETGPGEEIDSTPMIEFNSPNVDILDYSAKTWRDFLDDAKSAIFDELIDEAQSGVAKIIDREDLHSFLASIADNVYDHLLTKSLIILNGYRDISSREEPEITKPTSFIVKTEGDLVEELGVLLEKKAPNPFVLETIKDLARKRFATNKTATRAIKFLMIYDPLFALSPEEKNMLIATNVIDDRTRNININSYQVLNRLLFKNPDLLDEDYDSVAALMDAEIDKLTPEKQPMFNDNGEPE